VTKERLKGRRQKFTSTPLVIVYKKKKKKKKFFKIIFFFSDFFIFWGFVIFNLIR